MCLAEADRKHGIELHFGAAPDSKGIRLLMSLNATVQSIYGETEVLAMPPEVRIIGIQGMPAALIPAGEAIMIQQLHDRVNELETTLQEAKGRISSLEKDFAAMKSAQSKKIIVLRSIDRDEAKREISELFETGEALFYSDIATRLGLDLPLVVELCQELIDEGEVEVHADAV